MQTVPDIIKDALAKSDTQNDVRERACSYAFALGLIKVASEKREYLIADQAADIVRLRGALQSLLGEAREWAEALCGERPSLIDAINDAEGALLATKPGAGITITQEARR